MIIIHHTIHSRAHLFQMFANFAINLNRRTFPTKHHFFLKKKKEKNRRMIYTRTLTLNVIIDSPIK